MVTLTGSKYRIAFSHATICTGLLLCIMAAIPLYKEQIFLERGIVNPGGETAILIGFIIVMLFTFVSVVWLSSRIRKHPESQKGDAGILALGVICLILVAGEKIIVDEISREYSMGWEAVGEWIVLYLILSIQLFYNLFILRRLYNQK